MSTLTSHALSAWCHDLFARVKVEPMRRSRCCLVLVALLALVSAAASADAVGPALTFRVFARDVPAGTGIVWTGTRFLFVQNTANVVWQAPASGTPLTLFAKMSRHVEETRCVLSPGAHGFARGSIFCHAPNHVIYEFSANGRHRTVFAKLPAPYPPAGDGALAFDTVGRFGFRLLAATGRSGAAQPAGGAVFAVDAGGHVTKIGAYPGPGGADEIAVAPAGFGAAGGDALLTVDAGASGGALVAVSPTGAVQTVATFPDGPNPIVDLPVATLRSRGTPAAGLYLTDDTATTVLFAPATTLQQFGGDVLVGTEREALFFVVAPQGAGFTTEPLSTNLGTKARSLEAMILVR